MSIVDFDTGAWNDPWFQKLSTTAKLLFIYLWTNDHKNLSGIYVVTWLTIGNETGLTQKQINDGFDELSPKVLYDAGNSVVFVVNHVKRQFMRTRKISPKIISAISNNLMSLPESHAFIDVFLNKYKTLSIPYGYRMDTVSIPYGYPPSEGEGEGKGKSIKKGFKGELDAGFKTFWEAYPNKKSKSAAEKAWLKIKPNEQLLATMLATIERAKTSAQWTKNNGQFIPHPSTWLNQRRWEDEYAQDEGGSNSGSNQQNPRRSLKPGEPDPFDGLGRDC